MENKMTRIAAALVILGLAAALACDTIPAQDGCMTDMECEAAWNDVGDFGDETLQK